MTESKMSYAHFKRIFEVLKSDVIYGDGTQQCSSLTQIQCPLKNGPKQKDSFN